MENWSHNAFLKLSGGWKDVRLTPLEKSQRGQAISKEQAAGLGVTLGGGMTEGFTAEGVRVRLDTDVEGAPRPTTPPTPKWLPQFVPGLAAGQPIQQLPVITPSGQQWARTPWSQRRGLAGFADCTGGRPLLDIQNQMEMMQGATPQRPRGFAATRRFI